MSDVARPVSDPERPPRWLVWAVAIWVAATFAVVGGTPFFSEDWTQIAQNGGIASFFEAIDPSREPLRPFQHAFLWCVAHCGLDPTGAALPWIAHGVGFALHAVSCWLVFRLARLAGLHGASAFVAVVAFAAFPNVKSLAWTAAVGNPARVCFELVALVALVHHVRAPSWRTGIVVLAGFAAALTGHESGMLFPAIGLAWVLFVEGDTIRDGVRRAWRAVRDPWVVALALATLAYVVHLATRTQRHHRVKSWDALPANVVKAATSLLPETARAWIVDGFRGQGLAFAIACGLFALLAVGVLVVALRSKFGRFVLAAVGLELGLAILGAGFAQRYAYFSSAVLAVGLSVWTARGGSARRVTCVVLVLAWAVDSWVDARDFAHVRRLRDTLIERVEAARGPERLPVAILNPPDMIGAERDVPLFNWGAGEQLRAHGIDSELVLWRTRAYATSSDVELVDEARVELARRVGTPRVVDATDLRQP